MNSSSEEKIPTPASSTIDFSKVSHLYHETGKELLSKPSALCDLLEADGLPTAVVYCNSPSDADFVDVMLRKRGIGSQKLIGFVPKPKLDKAIEDFRSGLISVLVATDIGVRGVDLSNVEVIVHYSVPTDPELYLQRTGATGEQSEGSEKPVSDPPKLSKIISLISPLDIGNFHYVRKAYEFDFIKVELPDADIIAQGRFLSLKRAAGARTFDDQTKALAAQIFADSARDAIINLLVQNTMEVLPALRATVGRDEVRDEGDDEEDDFGDTRHGNRRGGNERREQPRNDRNDRGPRGRNDRGGDRDNRGGDRDNRGGDRDRGGDRQAGGGYRDDRGEGNRRDRGNDRNRSDSREDYGDDDQPRRGQRQAPPVREARIYVGAGETEGFSKDELGRLLTEQCNINIDTVKRFSLRKHYAFFDIGEEVAEDVISQIGESKLTNGSPVFIKRAITLSATRQEQDQRPRGDRSDDRDQDRGDDHGDEGSEGHDDYDGDNDGDDRGGNDGNNFQDDFQDGDQE